MSLSKGIANVEIPHTILSLVTKDILKFHCGPLVYWTIIDWGFAKPVGIKIIDHINHLKIGEKINEKFFTKWLKDNKSELDKDSFSDFDITELHDFLPILCCNKIAQTGGKEYAKQMKDPNSVESLLKKIKNFRNEVSHKYAETVEDNIGKMRDTMRECIRAAGKLYNKDQIGIDSKVKDLDDEFDEVLRDPTHLYENRVKYIAQKISSEVPSNLLVEYSPYFSVPLPGSSKKIDTFDIFQCSNLSVTTEDEEDKTKDNKIVFPCTKIYNNKQEKFVIITGIPGSGKTTLMRNMCKDILETSVNQSTPRYENTKQFKIPIYLECRYEQNTNIAKFLREYLKDFLSTEDDIYAAFKLVKGVVFLIDGYDEITDNCRKLIKSIIPFCRDNNASCIVSSRVDAGNNFTNELQDMNLNYTERFIEPISKMSHKVNFMRSYAGKMDASINSDKLVKSFENLTTPAQEVFSSPILLALFISLFVHDPKSVSKMKTENSAYEVVRTNFLREMERKLKLENVRNPEVRAKDVSNVLGKFCLKLFRAKKCFLVQEDYLEIVSEIKRIPVEIDIPSLLSGILTPEHSFKYNQYKSYQFKYSTIQEFFAAKYVSEKMKELQDDRNSKSQSEDGQLPKLLQVLGLDESQSDSEEKVGLDESQYDSEEEVGLHESQSDSEEEMEFFKSQSGIEEEMKRYGNIIKLLILDTLNNGELIKYRNTLTLMLKKYYQPNYRYGIYDSPVYLLDLILSSDSNADIISIVSDCLRGREWYYLRYYRHIEPMTDVVQKLKTAVKIQLFSHEAGNTQPLTKLLTVLRDDSEIKFDLYHSYDNYYEQLEGEFYTQLKKSKCIVTYFRACVSSEEHLSIVVRSQRGDGNDWLEFSTKCSSVFSFAVLDEHKGVLSECISCVAEKQIVFSNY